MKIPTPRAALAVALPLLLCALLGFSPAQGEDASPARFDLAGRLEGKVLYTNGTEARIEVAFERTPNLAVYAGRYTLTLITEDSPEVRSGKVEATVEGDVLRATFDRHAAQGKLAEAGSHAKFALYGTFADPGGVFMLYRYGR